ncbi:MAG TPA: hypothetical protein VF824_19585 [Thermoanaerobaculia bacterium]
MPSRRSLLLAIALGLCAAAVSFIVEKNLPTVAYRGNADLWYEGDLHRVFDNMTDRQSDHYRAKVHPLFSLLVYSAVYIPRVLLHVEPLLSVRIVVAAAAFAWGALLYALLEEVAGSVAGAVTFSLAAIVSAAMLFWGTVPETYLFGSVSIVLAMLAAIHVRRESALTAVSGLTMSFTITNWMAGIAAAWSALRWRRSLQVTVNAFALVVLLWGVQKYLFPSAQFFIGDKEERDYLFRPTPPRIAQAAGDFFVTTMVMPRSRAEFRDYQPQAVLLTQHAQLGSNRPWGLIATILWLALLALGAAGVARLAPPLRWTLLLTLAGQLVLHILYGDETFLYAMHFVPLLVVLAACSLRTRARKIALALAALFVVTAAVNNVRELGRARHYVRVPLVKPQ